MGAAAGRGPRAARPWTITRRLNALVLGLAIPLNLVIFAALLEMARGADSAQRTALLYTARSVAAGVDALFDKYLVIGQSLSQSPALLEDDLAPFGQEARRAIAPVRNALVAVVGTDGRQIANTSRDDAGMLPPRDAEGLAAQQRAFELHAPVISGVMDSAIFGDWSVTINLPVFKDGKPFRTLVIATGVKPFLQLLTAQTGMPEGWLAGIKDKSGRFVARIPRHDKYVGSPVSLDWQRLGAEEGIFPVTSLDSGSTVLAQAAAPLSGWMVGIGVRQSALYGATWRTLEWSAMAGVSLSLASVLLAIVLARNISQPIGQLRNNVAAMLTSAEYSVPQGPAELIELWGAIQHAAENRKQADERVRLLMREVNHRTKNMMAIVQAVAARTAASSPKDFVARFSERLQALSANQDLLVKSEWKGVQIAELVDAQLERLRQRAGERVTTRGPELGLNPKAVQAIGMAVHELAANACEHGALAAATGRVDVTWRVEGDGNFVLEWRESGGAPVAAPERFGFGYMVLTAFTQQTVNGHVQLDFEPSGVRWLLRCQEADAVHPAGASDNG